MNDNECREIYEYILERLKESDAKEDIIHEIEALKYKTVLNSKKVGRSKNKGEKFVDGDQMCLFYDCEEEVGQTETRMLTETERLLKAIEIIKIYAVTIPAIPYKIRQNLDCGEDVLWRTDENESIDGLQLKELVYLSSEEVQDNQQIIEDIINEVTTNGNNR